MNRTKYIMTVILLGVTLNTGRIAFAEEDNKNETTWSKFVKFMSTKTEKEDEFTPLKAGIVTGKIVLEDKAHVVSRNQTIELKDYKKELKKEKGEPDLLIYTKQNRNKDEDFSDVINRYYYNLPKGNEKTGYKRENVVLITYIESTGEYGVKYGDKLNSEMLDNINKKESNMDKKKELADKLNIEGSFSTKEMEGLIGNTLIELEDYTNNLKVISKDDLMSTIKETIDYVKENTRGDK